ncbi:GNAT family N-acetyltransferase [Robiginitalea sp. SC105]|uniref:GNAT family N-acetyltransferase n=1 Tax=Robiginitalea sp. SC105 TaxID=2762332 RepID=UPI0016399D0A|nr:GNAT family N-acetyltransferase [Robiginitalea sp. SC105]MBC2839912.1 GNAT family N-acetyltransferase [Robiginitalea sp. SC105]
MSPLKSHGNVPLTPDGLLLEPLERKTLPVFLEAGRRAYTDHYCHLWPGGDPEPYLGRNLVPGVVLGELANPAYRHWLVKTASGVAGICVISTDKEYPGFHEGKSLFIDKVYLIRAFTGQGIGSAVLGAVREFARQSAKSGVWLKAMQKGPALRFYQKEGFRILGESTIPYPEVLPAQKPMWTMGQDL